MKIFKMYVKGKQYPKILKTLMPQRFFLFISHLHKSISYAGSPQRWISPDHFKHSVYIRICLPVAPFTNVV